MSPIPRHWTRTVVVGLLGVCCAAGSVKVERKGPDHGIYCALGKVGGYDIYCPELKLNGGWPAPFLFDRPGVSVEHKLNTVEDDFRAWPFVSDVAFYVLLLLAFGRLLGAARRIMRGGKLSIFGTKDVSRPSP